MISLIWVKKIDYELKYILVDSQNDTNFLVIIDTPFLSNVVKDDCHFLRNGIKIFDSLVLWAQNKSRLTRYIVHKTIEQIEKMYRFIQKRDRLTM